MFVHLAALLTFPCLLVPSCEKEETLMTTIREETISIRRSLGDDLYNNLADIFSITGDTYMTRPGLSVTVLEWWDAGPKARLAGVRVSM